MSREDWIFCLFLASMFWVVVMAVATASVDYSWRKWSVVKGVAEYDRTTGKWTELPGCPKTEGE